LPSDVTATDMQSYALFWRGRDRMHWTLVQGETPAEITLNVTAAEPVAGLTFEFQRAIGTADGGATVSADRHRIVLPDLKAGGQATVHIRYGL
jgi:hypothetical protein